MLFQSVSTRVLFTGPDLDDMDKAANRQRMIVKVIDNFSRDYCESWHQGSPGKFLHIYQFSKKVIIYESYIGI